MKRRMLTIFMTLVLCVGSLSAMSIQTMAADPEKPYRGSDFASGELAERLESILYDGISKYVYTSKYVKTSEKSGYWTVGTATTMPSVFYIKDGKYQMGGNAIGGSETRYAVEAGGCTDTGDATCLAYAFAVFANLFDVAPGSGAIGNMIDQVVPEEYAGKSMADASVINCQNFRNWGVKFGAMLRTKTSGGHSIITYGYCDNLTTVTIPSSVLSIEDYAFYDCESLATVHYSGTEKEWNEIYIGKNNDALLNATIIYNSTGGDSDNTPGGDEGNIPGGDPDVTPGDIDGDGEVTMDDAIQLFNATMFPEAYPIPDGQQVDYDGNGVFNMDDAIYLFNYTMFPEAYPI